VLISCANSLFFTRNPRCRKKPHDYACFCLYTQ